MNNKGINMQSSNNILNLDERLLKGIETMLVKKCFMFTNKLILKVFERYRKDVECETGIQVYC